jgi:cell division protein FtsW
VTAGTATGVPAGSPGGPGPGGTSGGSEAPAARRGLSRRLETPLTSYYLVLGATTALVVIGLVMVLSSSMIESYVDTGSSYSVFLRQLVFAALGVPVMWVASRLRPATWQALAWPMVVVALVGQLLVFTPLGVQVNGNRNWIELAGFRMQPSEAGKLALVVWGAAVLSRKRALLDQPAHALVPVVPGAALLLLLVLFGHDLGTSLVLMALVAALLFVAGAPLRVFAAAGGVAALAVFVLIRGSENRMQRVTAWGSGGCGGEQDYLNTCWQSIHGLWALASGGWFGVGLGASREKWGLLPEAHNDFIFAVIGEELGLTGTLVVLALFAALGIGLFRIVLRTDDLFVKIATGGVMTWVLGQAVVNIGAVLGLLPVVGIPLPLVSSGGSALVMTMTALGMVIGFARREPGASEALATRASLVQRSLAVLPVRAQPGRRLGRQGGRSR